MNDFLSYEELIEKLNLKTKDDFEYFENFIALYVESTGSCDIETKNPNYEEFNNFKIAIFYKKIRCCKNCNDDCCEEFEYFYKIK